MENPLPGRARNRKILPSLSEGQQLSSSHQDLSSHGFAGSLFPEAAPCFQNRAGVAVAASEASAAPAAPTPASSHRANLA